MRARPFLLLVLAAALVSCGMDDGSAPLSSSAAALNVSYSCGTWQDTGYTNGDPVAITLVTVDGYPMQIDTANAFLTMEAAANAAGITLALNDGFRTNSQQQYYWNCYQNCNCNSCNQAAAPGYSNHQSGHAVDINLSSGVYGWLTAHGGSFGFSQTTSETWHWEWWGGGSPQTYCSVLPPDGTYCGGHGVSGDARTLYRVAGGGLSTVEVCPGWCGTTPNGDFCAALHHQRTEVDLDGDGKADVCARASDKIHCWLSSGAGFPTEISGPPLSDANGWAPPEYDDSIQYADVNGDGKSDVCARGIAGFFCWLSNGSGLATQINGPLLSDAAGYGLPQYRRTLQMADVNGDGKADVCSRASDGFHCWLSTGSGFSAEHLSPILTNANGWAAPQYYSTIQLADVNGDGKADVCARGTAGFTCWLASGSGTFVTELPTLALSDAAGYGLVQYATTLQMADVNGDGKADVCSRASDGFHCWFSTGSAFGPEHLSHILSNDLGWAYPQYYATIQMADLNADGKADVCARAGDGLHCWLSNGSTFTTALSGPAFTDAAGYGLAQYDTTLQLADLNGDGRADACIRTSAGFPCYLSTGTGFAAAPIDGPPFTDDNGWRFPRYFTTLHLVGSAGRRVAPPTSSTSSSTSSTSSTGTSGTTGGTTSSTSGTSGATSTTSSGSTGFDGSTSSPGSTSTSGSTVAPATAAPTSGCGCNAGEGEPLWAMLAGLLFSIRGMRKQRA